MNVQDYKVGDKTNRCFPHNGTTYPETTFTITRINRATYGVYAEIPEDHPAYKDGLMAMNAYLNKRTGLIHF